MKTLLAFLLLIATATAQTPAVFLVESYGAVGNGTTDDRAAIQATLDAAATAGGGNVVFNPAKTYHLGSLATATAALHVVSMTNVQLQGHGARLTVNTTADVAATILRLTNPLHVRINGLSFEDLGADIEKQFRCAAAVELLSAAPDEDEDAIGDVVLDNLTATKCRALCLIGGDQTHRLAGISLRDCNAVNCFYGVVCQNNGDRLRASGLRCLNARRAYFVYGVEDHDVDLAVESDGNGVAQDACCLVKCYDRDTRAIRLRARFTGTVSKYTNGVCLEHQRSTGSGSISGVDVAVDVASPGAMTPVRFRSFHDNGSTPVEESATANKWTGITLGGNLATTGAESIAFGTLVSQGAEGRLALLPSVSRPQSRQPHYPGFVVTTAHGRELRTIKGNIDAQTVTIPFANLDTCPFEVIVSTWAQNNVADVGIAKRTIIRDILFLQNAGGSVTIKSQVNDRTASYNGAATVTYAGIGQNLIVGIDGYTGTNGLAHIEVEYISRGP